MPSPSPDSSPFIGGRAGQHQLMTDQDATCKIQNTPRTIFFINHLHILIACKFYPYFPRLENKKGNIYIIFYLKPTCFKGRR